MAQVVRAQGWIGPLIMFVIGLVLLIVGVPSLFQWLPWVAQTALVVGVDRALEVALVPVLVGGACTFIGFLLLRGGFGSLVQLGRGAASRTGSKVRSGVQQAQRSASTASSQAEHLVKRVPQSWRERIEAAASAVEQERAKQSAPVPQAQQRPQGYQGQGQQQGQGQRLGQPYQGQGQQQGQSQWMQQEQRPGPVAAGQQLPGGDRLQRIEQLRQRVDARAQQATQGQQQAAKEAADQARRVAKVAAERVTQGMPMHLDPATEALLGRLDAVDSERIRRQGSSLVRSSLTSGALSKTSLSTNSLFRHR